MTESNKISLRLEDVQKEENPKVKVMYIRTSFKKSLWMAKNKVSPSLVLNKALDQLMESQDE